MTDTVSCCARCRYHYPLVKFDYAKGGCEHTDIDGFACLMDISTNGAVIQMVGIDASREFCECFIPSGGVISWH